MNRIVRLLSFLSPAMVGMPALVLVASTVPALAADAMAKPAMTAGAAMSAPAATTPSLYKRLGGYDALAAVTDDFIGRLAGDPALAKFFGGHSSDSLGHIRQLVVDQLCAATGGPCVYIGRDMKTAHQGMGITEADWNKAAGHLVETLDHLKVPEKEKGEVLALVSTLKSQIVQQPAAAASTGQR
jgi:hemoglobin